MFTEAFEAILRGYCTPAQVRAIESGGTHFPLWNAIVDAGFLELMASEEVGGANLDLASVMPIFCALGAHAVPLPVGQAIVLRTLLPQGELPPLGIPTFAPALVHLPDGGLLAPLVPFGALADQVLGEMDGALWVLDTNVARRDLPGLHRDATCNLHWNAAELGKAGRRLYDTAPAGILHAWSAALHAALLAGALRRCFELTLQYGNDRVQFGKSIGKFQTVQHQLAVMAEHVSVARMAVAGAFTPGARCPSLLPAAVAKAAASEAVTVVAAIAHALHGAIGVTEEYDLQLFTRRLHVWRMAHGSETHWHRVVGQALLDGTDHCVDFVRALQSA